MKLVPPLIQTGPVHPAETQDILGNITTSYCNENSIA